MTTDAMKQALGSGYDEALAKDVVAKGIAATAGQPGEVEQPEEESVSVLQAMDNAGKDRTEEISKLPPSLRAREAAAHGFAAGTSGNKKMADRYFDIAFSALESVWSNRTPENNAPAVVEEVSEAAAQVNPVAALQRSQRLQDPSAQAISMLAVARVVAGQSDPVVAGH
jgi:polyphosphate kinase 2 (PPK2 family)